MELTNYTLAATGSGSGINGFYFALETGDVCAIDCQTPDDAHSFLRALATLISPLKGTYFFKGQKYDLRRYDKTLYCKQHIGYIAPDAALISNLTVRQNLMLQRYYHENRLDIDLDEESVALCNEFGITLKLDKRPAALNAMETQAAIIIRELTKRPEVLLLAQPEDFVGHAKFSLMIKIFDRLIADRLPIVFLSYDQRLIRRYANRKILITHGSLMTVTIKEQGL